MDLTEVPVKAESVAIIIPVFNEERYLAACLDSIEKLDYPSDQLEVILVDNGSTDGTLEIARRYEIQVLSRPDVKVGAVRNYGVKNSTADIIVFLDSDCTVDPDWLKRGIAKLVSQKGLVLGGQYLLRPNPSWLEKYWMLESEGSVIHQRTLVGGCIFIRRSDFLSVNGFKEELNSGEDSELHGRLFQNGFEVVIDPTLSVVHLGYPTKIPEFIKRQIWHSADYVSQLPASLKDKVFINTCVFMFGLILFVISIISSNINFALVSLAVVVTSILMLTIKRVMRAKYKGRAYFHIFLVDFLYLIGRSGGVILGIKKMTKPKEETKVARR